MGLITFQELKDPSNNEDYVNTSTTSQRKTAWFITILILFLNLIVDTVRNFHTDFLTLCHFIFLHLTLY